MASTSPGSGGAALGARKIALNGRNPMCSSTGEQVSAGTYLAATRLAAGSERMSLTRDSVPYPMKVRLPSPAGTPGTPDPVLP